MAGLRLDVPPHVAEVVRHLPPDIKRSVREGLRALVAAARSGEPLRGELEGLWRYRVRRFRIVYEIASSQRVIRIFAVGRRQTIYEEVADAVRSGGKGPTAGARPGQRKGAAHAGAKGRRRRTRREKLRA